MHKTEDYKISAVKYYIKNDISLDKVCDIFECKKSSLKRWIERYNIEKTITRHNRYFESYKITKEHVKYVIKLLKSNEQITMIELSKLIKEKYKYFDITPQHLGAVIRDNNITRKRTKQEHYPKERYGKPTDKQKELDVFYKEVSKYDIRKIICLDETSIKPAMMLEYSRCSLGKKCIIKTDNSYLFRKFTLLCAINNSKYIGYKLYNDGGMTKEKLVKFLEDNIFNKYKNNLIILDNAGSHNNQYVKDAIIKSGNKYLFSIPYTPKTNGPIENYFNQIKHYLKLNKKVLRFDELEKEVTISIKNVKKENYRNYFNYAYKKDKLKKYIKKNSTLKRNLKNYKD